MRISASKKLSSNAPSNFQSGRQRVVGDGKGVEAQVYALQLFESTITLARSVLKAPTGG